MLFKSKFQQACMDTVSIHSNTIWCHCTELDFITVYSDVSHTYKLTMSLQKLIVPTSITPISWTYLAACQQGVSKTLMEFISINLLLCLHNTPITFIQAKHQLLVTQPIRTMEWCPNFHVRQLWRRQLGQSNIIHGVENGDENYYKVTLFSALSCIKSFIIGLE